MSKVRARSVEFDADGFTLNFEVDWNQGCCRALYGGNIPRNWLVVRSLWSPLVGMHALSARLTQE